MSKFVPTTTQSPSIGGDTGGYDQMLEVLGGLMQQRKQVKDAEWQAEQRNYTLGQNERTLQKQAIDDKNAEVVAKLSSGEVPYTGRDLENLYANGKLTKQQYDIFTPRASDYVDYDEQLVKAATYMQENWGKLKPADIASISKEYGVKPIDVKRYWDEQQQIDRQNASDAKMNKILAGKGEQESDYDKAVTKERAEIDKEAYQLRTTGMTFGNYNVIISGMDYNPVAWIQGTEMNYKRVGNKYYYLLHKKGGSTQWREFIRNRNGEYKATEGKNYKLPEDVQDALNRGLRKFQDNRAASALKGAKNPFASQFKDIK